MPEISVILPVYNGEVFLRAAIESVLKQTFNDFELLILDDGSSDQSGAIAQTSTTTDSRIRLLRNGKNIGLQRTLNYGIEESRGRYIARIDCDDIWRDPEKLEKQVRYLDHHPDCAVVGTFAEMIDANSQRIGTLRYATTDTDIRRHFLIANQFAHPSVLVRKSALDRLGPYSEHACYRTIEDYELWLRLGTRYQFANIPETCLAYRIHDRSISMQGGFRQRLGGLWLACLYATRYPGALQAVCIKLLSLFVSRSSLDALLKRSPRIRKLYALLTGSEKY